MRIYVTQVQNVTVLVCTKNNVKNEFETLYHACKCKENIIDVCTLAHVMQLLENIFLKQTPLRNTHRLLKDWLQPAGLFTANVLCKTVKCRNN